MAYQTSLTWSELARKRAQVSTPTHIPAEDIQAAIKRLEGVTTGWTNPKGPIPTAELRGGLVDAGLEEELCPELLSPALAFSRATADFKKEGRIIGKVRRDGDWQTYQITFVHNTGKELDHKKQCLVKLNCLDGSLQGDDSNIVDEIALAMNKEHIKRNGQDLTRLIQRLCKNNFSLFPIVAGKGVAYFTPAAELPWLLKLKILVERCGGFLSLFPIPKGDVLAKSSITKAVSDGITGLLDQLTEAADGIEESFKSNGEGRKFKQSTIDARVKDWEEAKFKIESYHQYLEGCKGKLSARAAKIGERFSELTKQLSEG